MGGHSVGLWDVCAELLAVPLESRVSALTSNVYQQLAPSCSAVRTCTTVAVWAKSCPNGAMPHQVASWTACWPAPIPNPKPETQTCQHSRSVLVPWLLHVCAALHHARICASISVLHHNLVPWRTNGDSPGPALVPLVAAKYVCTESCCESDTSDCTCHTQCDCGPSLPVPVLPIMTITQRQQLQPSSAGMKS